MKPAAPVNRRCHRRTFLILVVTSVLSIWKSTSYEQVFAVEDNAEEQRSREDVEFAPILTSINNAMKFVPRIHHLDDTFVSSLPPLALSPNLKGKSGKSSRKLSYPLSTSEALEQAYNGTDLAYRDFERDWFTNCDPVVEITTRPTCNNLHELNAFEHTSIILLSMEGSWRSVWKVQDDSQRSAILKMLQLDRDYTAESFSAHELDGKVMERLTGSPHVVSSYGFCGQSVLTQIAENSGANVIKDPTLSWRERLSMGRDIAKGLAELHALEPWTDYDDIIQTLSQSSEPVIDLRARTSTTTSRRPAIFAHHDINAANMISLQPKQVHWNDFNLGILSKKHRATGQACHVPVRYEGVLWRSPEEIQNKLGNLSTMQPADIFSFGTMLFTVFTKHQPWTHLEEGEMTDEIIETKKKRGDLPHLPEKYQPQRLEAKILWAASKACFRRDPGDRPTAYHLALGLGLALERLQSHKELSDEDIENLFTA